jgi:predicted transcriptional regulator
MENIWDKGDVGVLEVTEILNQNRPIARNTLLKLIEGVHEKD